MNETFFRSNWYRNRGSQKEFAKWAAKFLSKSLMPKLADKGSQYAPDKHAESALENFNACGDFLGLSQQAYLMSLGTKHWHAISRWAFDKQHESGDKIAERCVDIIVYMLLLLFALSDD